jgi:Leucine-rich repeat (LRR) protein
MSAFNIEEYLNSLPENTETIHVSNKNLTYIPSLKQFTDWISLRCDCNNLTQLPELNSSLIDLHCDNNQLTQLPQLNSSLQYLFCYNNQLTQLPQFNSSLQQLNCFNNQLTQLPQLNSSLQYLHCYNNQLTQLPELNSCLEKLNCSNNQLTQLPELNSSLQYLNCSNNELPFKLIYTGRLTDTKRNELNCGIKILKRFKELYMLIKFKKHFRNWLWIKVRLAKIQIQFHPDNLNKMLSSINDEELDDALNNW